MHVNCGPDGEWNSATCTESGLWTSHGVMPSFSRHSFLTGLLATLPFCFATSPFSCSPSFFIPFPPLIHMHVHIHRWDVTNDTWPVAELLRPIVVNVEYMVSCPTLPATASTYTYIHVSLYLATFSHHVLYVWAWGMCMHAS